MVDAGRCAGEKSEAKCRCDPASQVPGSGV